METKTLQQKPTSQRSKLFVSMPLGLKEMVICNGMIRELINQHDEVSIPANSSNRVSVQRMFRDVPASKLKIIFTPSTRALRERTESHKRFSKILTLEEGSDESLYLQASVPFCKRWESFFVERDGHREVHSAEKSFILLCDTPEKRLSVASDETFIRIQPLGHIFNWMHVMETAKEVHCADNYYLALADSLNLQGKLKLHGPTTSNLRLKWEQS